MKNKLGYLFFVLTFMSFANIGTAQEITITGTVMDNTGILLPGVNIVIKDSSKGTQTDFDGNYSLTASSGDTLLFSYLGMETQNITVSSSGVHNITLQENSNQLEEIVVTGYSKQSVRNITGSVIVVKAEDIAATSPVDIEQSLQGLASGVTVGSEGGPGGEAMVRIRGFGTINNNNPLYVIDGTPTNTGINQLNPSDIKSMQILKDASSAAIYGFRASNGVILITTKGGKYNSDTKFTFDSYVGVDNIPKSAFPDLLSTQETANVIWTRFNNDGTAPSHPQYGNGSTPVLPNYLTPAGANSADLSTYDPETNKITRANKEGTDWFDEYFNAAFVQNYNLGISGGSETAKFHVGIGALTQDGVALHTSFDRYVLRVNSEFKVTNNFRIGESFSISYSDRIGSTGSQFTGGDISFLYRSQPIIPVYDIAGNYAGPQSPGLGNGINPVASATRNKNNLTRRLRTIGGVYAELDVFKDLTFKTNFGVDYDANNSSFFSFKNPEVAEPTNVNKLTENNSYAISTTWYNTLSYSKKIGNHTIDAVVGTESYKLQEKFLGASRNKFLINNINYRYLDRGEGSRDNNGEGNKEGYFSVFGKVDYSYNDKYLLSASLRRDASSKFDEQHRADLFPGYSAAWRISSEPFMENVSFINDLKIKAGYGELGNESIPQGRIYSQYNNNDNTNYDLLGTNSSVLPGYGLFILGNKDLTWEYTSTKNLGVDGALFNNTFMFNLEFYNSVTEELLVPEQANITIIGNAVPKYINNGTVENNGFDLSLGYSKQISEDLKFDTSVNISAYKNKVKDLGDNSDYFLDGNLARETKPSRTQSGHAISSFHGFIIDGIIQNDAELAATGDYLGKEIGTFKYRDLNNDGVINDEDRDFIGNPHPDFTYSFNMGLEYKNIDFGIFFQGSQGNDIYNFTKFFTDYNSFPGAKSRDYLNSWSPSNTGARLPKLSNNPAEHYSSASSYYIEDGSYLRLKNVQLGYSLPEQITSKLKVEKLRVYIQAKNLYTWTKYSGLDPEINLQYGGGFGNLDIGIDRGAYPVARSFLFGVNLSL
ncbi:TonB-linked SusC/RagA family outer membrane protein [Aquimarina sp. MAR_2010_214]|uniref:SusC/RagA family TonB-linked outer membrane protein n=1 Tax=Aquimarina sp. MAR_2010_214 TaxID=1250026 RepID=UPI000C705979|nr:TonB-dependent receptor [Aquimarina sp. MAR_2010_214]PKV52394.1 TonB-linked SusC/RagA family outer membrane protein [Aquimarina sp. MAR_2010_214]